MRDYYFYLKLTYLQTNKISELIYLKNSNKYIFFFTKVSVELNIFHLKSVIGTMTVLYAINVTHL